MVIIYASDTCHVSGILHVMTECRNSPGQMRGKQRLRKTRSLTWCHSVQAQVSAFLNFPQILTSILDKWGYAGTPKSWHFHWFLSSMCKQHQDPLLFVCFFFLWVHITYLIVQKWDDALNCRSVSSEVPVVVIANIVRGLSIELSITDFFACIISILSQKLHPPPCPFFCLIHSINTCTQYIHTNVLQPTYCV